jgi:hypothetical protein
MRHTALTVPVPRKACGQTIKEHTAPMTWGRSGALGIGARAAWSSRADRAAIAALAQKRCQFVMRPAQRAAPPRRPPPLHCAQQRAQAPQLVGWCHGGRSPDADAVARIQDSVAYDKCVLVAPAHAVHPVLGA